MLLWQAYEPQRLTPCGQVAMPFAGRSINLTDSEKQHRGRGRD